MPPFEEEDVPTREHPLPHSRKVGYRFQKQAFGRLTVPVAGGPRVHRRLPGGVLIYRRSVVIRQMVLSQHLTKHKFARSLESSRVARSQGCQTT